MGLFFERIRGALSPVGVLNALSVAEQVGRRNDIPFGRSLTLDAYVPRRHAKPPTLVFFYGGGWESGDKSMYRFVGTALAARGFVTVVPNYRVYPEVAFPGFLDDAALAVRWARDNAGDFGGNPGSVVLIGHSAGAHIAAMLAFDRQWLGGVGLDSDHDISAFVGLAGPYDFLPLHSKTLQAIFGPQDQLPATQPINFVDRRVIPSLLATGANDRVVDPSNSTRLADRIYRHGGRVRLRTYPRVGHELTIGAFALPLRPLLPVLADTVSFINELAVEAPELAASDAEQSA